MNIHFKKLNLDNSQQLMALAKWDNEHYDLITPVKNKDQPVEVVTCESLRKKYSEISTTNFSLYFIYDDKKPIGNFSIMIDPNHLFKKIAGTCWLGTTIGEKEYWGTGVSAKTMAFCEKEAKALGLQRIEIGIFEFNIRSLKSYQKLGFIEIGRIKDFTYWNGRYWDDIRLEKILT